MLPENVVGSSDLNKILHGGHLSSGVSLGGEFVSSSNTKKQDSEKQGGLLAGVLNESSEAHSAARRSFNPPSDFVVDATNLSKPAIWNNSEYSRTIKLTDD